MAIETESRAVELMIDGKSRVFDIDNPVLPDWIEQEALPSANYPYDKKLKSEIFDAELIKLQEELVKMQAWQQKTGSRVMAVFEGRDAAGKGGAIASVTAYTNPRTARIVALTKPTETERSQWYFQRYVSTFPTAGELVLFDRSWYNRAGVEPVMGFCKPEDYEHFLKVAPQFEKLIPDEGIIFFKFYIDIGRQMQLKRFHERRHSTLKNWKLSPMDIAALGKWDDYTAKRDRMLKETDSKYAPWSVVRGNDKRRARLEILRHILSTVDYEGRDKSVLGKIDDKIIGDAALLKGDKDKDKDKGKDKKKD